MYACMLHYNTTGPSLVDVLIVYTPRAKSVFIENIQVFVSSPQLVRHAIIAKPHLFIAIPT